MLRHAATLSPPPWHMAAISSISNACLGYHYSISFSIWHMACHFSLYIHSSYPFQNSILPWDTFHFSLFLPAFLQLHSIFALFHFVHWWQHPCHPKPPSQASIAPNLEGFYFLAEGNYFAICLPQPRDIGRCEKNCSLILWTNSVIGHLFSHRLGVMESLVIYNNWFGWIRRLLMRSV